MKTMGGKEMVKRIWKWLTEFCLRRLHLLAYNTEELQERDKDNMIS